MPWGDRTGPLGLGPMTGRAAGYCAGFPVPGFMNPYVPGFGRGFWRRGFGRGLWGRGRGFWWRGFYSYPVPYYAPVPYTAPEYSGTYPQSTKEEERVYLEGVVKSLEKELKTIRERLAELSKSSD